MMRVGVSYRLMVYAPDGTKKGVLPRSFNTSITWADKRPLLTVNMPATGLRSDFLDDVGTIVVLEFAGPGDTAYETDYNCTFIKIEQAGDRLAKAKTITYTLPGIDVALDWAQVYLPTIKPPEQGPTQPTRDFNAKSPGQILVPLFNENQARGWRPTAAKTFALGVDSNSVAWSADPDDLTTASYDIKLPLSTVRDQLVEAQKVETAWLGEDFYAFVPGTLGRDLTSTVPVLVDAGVLTAPESRTGADLVSEVTVVAENGNFWYEPQPGSVDPNPLGWVGRGMDATNVEDEATARALARTVLKAGASEQEQITRTWSGRNCPVMPLLHARQGDTLAVQRGWERNDPTKKMRVEPMEIVGMTLTMKGRNISGSYILGDRRMRVIDRALARVARVTGGSAAGYGGQVGRPSNYDPRVPVTITPTSITVVEDMDAGGHTVGKATVTWVKSEFATDGTALQIDRMLIGKLRTGSGEAERLVEVVDADNGTWTSPAEVSPAQGYKYVIAQESHDQVPGAWSTQQPATIVKDEYAQHDVTGLLDPAFTSTFIQNKRKVGVPSLTFSGGRALITAVGDELRMDVGRDTDSGLVSVTAGDTYLPKIKAKRTGGTAASVRIRLRWYDNTKTLMPGSPVNVITTVVTTTDAYYSGTVVAPAGAAYAAVSYTGQSFTGGPTLSLVEPSFARQATSERIGDLQVVTAKIPDNAITEPKHAATSVSSRTIVAKAVLNGHVDDDAADPRVIATEAVQTAHLDTGGVDVPGTVTTLSGLTVGGLSLQDVDFPSGGAIGDVGGGSMFFTSAVSSFSGSGQYVGTWVAVSTRDSKTAVKPLTLEQARVLLDLKPVTFKHRDAWLRERNKRVIPAREIHDRKRGKIERRRERVIPGKTDPNRYAGLVAEDVADAGLEELVARDAEGKPAGVAYDRLALYLLTLVQDQERRLRELEGLDRPDEGLTGRRGVGH